MKKGRKLGEETLSSFPICWVLGGNRTLKRYPVNWELKTSDKEHADAGTATLLKGVSACHGKKYPFLKPGKILTRKMKEHHLLPHRTMLTRPSRRSCATPSSIMAPSGECHQGSLPRPVMRTFPPWLSGPESWWEEPRLSTHFSVCSPLLSIYLPQKMNMNLSHPIESPLTLQQTYLLLSPSEAHVSHS